MFCENCGRELGEDTTFCALCGTRQSATVIAASNQPSENSESLASIDTASVPTSAPINAGAPASVPVNATASVPLNAPASAPVNTYASAPVAPAIPTPNTIPTTGALSYPAVTVTKKEKPPRERRYTLGHLILCLATAGVMAVAAGIFAGLYFSVI